MRPSDGIIRWALYYDCEWGRFACTSTRRMTFSVGGEPALLAQKANVEKVLRDYKRNAIDHYAARGERQYLATVERDGHHAVRHIGKTLPGADDPTLLNFLIVPCVVTPQFPSEQ